KAIRAENSHTVLPCDFQHLLLQVCALRGVQRVQPCGNDNDTARALFTELQNNRRNARGARTDNGKVWRQWQFINRAIREYPVDRLMMGSDRHNRAIKLPLQ